MKTMMAHHISGDALYPHESFSFAPAFSERFLKNWGGPRAQEFGHFRTNVRDVRKPISPPWLLCVFCPTPHFGTTYTLEITLTIRHKNITYPNKFYLNNFLITVTRFEIFRINFRKLPDTYCMCVSCVTLSAWEPCPC